ncbi:hypothetical protein SHKM778_51790 [Streptomyces sp. KM77-8]|uniref:Uncharacterized protein n=1 Tax=Streptomyces haneummycinicus TaxID=3074435 RepID=A0AAT9HMR4_9ACTN
MQPFGLDRSGAEQVEVGQDMGGRVGEDGQGRGGRDGVGGRDPQPRGTVVGNGQQQPVCGADPDGEGAGRTSGVAQDDTGLLGPAVHGAVVSRREESGWFGSGRLPSGA